jgi:hypothetical protein
MKMRGGFPGSVYHIFLMFKLARIAAAPLFMGLFGISALQGATLEGRWKLVEEHAGSGHSNLAAPDAPLRLEFRISGSTLEGRIWTVEKPPRSYPWPSFATEHGTLPLRLEGKVFSPASDQARVAYRVQSPEGGDSELRVEEEYRLAEGGNVLLGTVRITALEGGAGRGSYKLQRRFEREP